MRRYYFSILSLLFLSSCTLPLTLQRHETAPSASYSYCNLLHVQPIPHPAKEPKPYIGIYMAAKELDPTVHPCAEENFIQVAGIIKGSPAANAGIRIDDVILSLNGNAVCEDAGQVIPAFKRTIEKQKIGAPVQLDILRGEERLSLTVTLEKLPTHDQPETKHPDIEQCATRESLFERDLLERGALPLFHDIVDGLYVRSNVVHNPGADYERKVHPLQLNEVTYLMRHPLAAGEVARELSGRLSAPLDNRIWQGSDILSRAASLLDIDVPPVHGPDEVSFPALLKVMEEAKKNIDDALDNLTPEEKALLQDKAFDPVDDDQWNRILEVSLKVDRLKLMNAVAPLFAFLTQDNLALLKKDINGRFSGTDKPVLHEAVTSFGKVVIGGAGPNTYSEDAALILDLGGDDLYLNNAGGTRPGMPVSLVIEWGGDDRYVSRENFSQAAGVLGAGILIDLDGRDVFISHDGSQGAGFWGLGFLYHGDGNATFNARKFSQGTGQMGIGMLINGGSDDRYMCSYSGQGLGLFGGAGILFDKTGNDLYQLGGLEPDFRDPKRATQSFGQGFGLGSRSDKDKDGVPGGVGMLIDKKGDDEYLADYFAQGASYYYGLGILDDWSGNDHYIAGRYSQGAGIHSSVGVLFDRGGDDFYYSSFGVGQGMGHDFGVGFLEDDRGDDRYEGGTLVRGAATNGSLGVFLDPAGDDLHARSGSGQGHGDDETGMGIVIRGGHGGNEPAVTIEKGKE